MAETESGTIYVKLSEMSWFGATVYVLMTVSPGQTQKLSQEQHISCPEMLHSLPVVLGAPRPPRVWQAPPGRALHTHLDLGCLTVT